MAASKRRSKDAFIRQARENFNLTQAQARALYREFSAKYRGLVRASDLKRHPIVARRLARATQIQRPVDKDKSIRMPEVGSSGGSAVSKRAVRTVADWDSVYDDYDYDPVEYESSADYGEV